jgi:hypothetical protein
MEKREHGPKDIETTERMKALGGAMANAAQHKARGEHETEEGARYRMSAAEAQALIADWPKAPKTCAQQMIEQYGPPNEGTPTKLFWYRNGPWKRSIVTRDVLTHNFPAPHSDFLTQYIDYKAPIDKFDEIGLFDGSCLVDRTAGEAAGRCDSEAANFITLNLMHEIVTGRRSVEDARKTYAEAMSAYMLGRPAPYAEGFQFAVAQGGTEDQDEARIAGAMAKQALGKAKDVLT